MNSDEISVELPAPRDDEPQSLRSDIVNELADHLQCAFNRELYTHGADPESAVRARVLSRFGNPSTIARRLWCDAMQERIMSQRIATTAAVVAAVACLGMFVFLWQSSAANREMLQQSQQMNSQLLEQMQGLAGSLTAAGQGEENRPAEWNQLQVRCVADSEDGPPLEDVRVYLESASENTVGIPPTTLTTDGEGLVDFGLVLYGQYTASLTAPNEMRMRQQISVRPGYDTLEIFVCPTGDGLSELQLEAQFEGEAAPPESLRDRIWYLVTLVRKNALSSIWSRPVTDPRHFEVIHCFLGPNGEMFAIDRDREPLVAENQTGLFGQVTDGVWSLPHETSETLHVEPGFYSFGEGAVCIEENDPSSRTLRQILIPDARRGRAADDPSTVAWGRTNSLTFPVSTTTFAMLSRVIEAAPELEVANLRVRADPGLRGSVGELIDALRPGSRVALALSSSRLQWGQRRDEEPPAEPLLTGVEVVSFRENRSRFEPGVGGSTRFYELHLLCTPDERAFLEVLSSSRSIYASSVDPETERTSIDPALQSELMERYDLSLRELE